MQRSSPWAPPHVTQIPASQSRPLHCVDCVHAPHTPSTQASPPKQPLLSWHSGARELAGSDVLAPPEDDDEELDDDVADDDDDDEELDDDEDELVPAEVHARTISTAPETTR